jgi:23S rRNA pseudouridine1911/1915/1917 synthase
MVRHGHIAPESTFSFTVPENSTPCRIDRFITTLFPDYSRTYFQHIIDSKGIVINNIPAKKSSALVHPNDHITIQFPAQQTASLNTILDKTTGVKILAATEHFMIIHKPANLLVHPTSTKSSAISLTDWIRHHHSDINAVGLSDRPGIIHRLDKETSGIMIITRTNYAHNNIGGLFRNRKIQKTYKAIVAGQPPQEGTITLAIGRDPMNPIKMATFLPQFSFPPSPRLRRTGHSKPGSPSAQYEREENQPNFVGQVKVRHAQTHYKVLEYFKDAALIEVKPTTGRTHQIRVHMKAIGHPIIGDALYAKKSPLINRQALHAEKLSFNFEDTSYSFSDELPDDFQQLINQLR